ncbi:MAG: hypothetical protein AVDCRST_MAG36-578, partial [uncultured Nocardioidaceae bacterium]
CFSPLLRATTASAEASTSPTHACGRSRQNTSRPAAGPGI